MKHKDKNPSSKNKMEGNKTTRGRKAASLIPKNISFNLNIAA